MIYIFCTTAKALHNMEHSSIYQSNYWLDLNIDKLADVG